MAKKFSKDGRVFDRHASALDGAGLDELMNYNQNWNNEEEGQLTGIG